MLEPAAMGSAPSSMIHFRLQRRKGHFTRSFTDSLRRLPFVMVCHRAGMGEAENNGALLFDLGTAPPLSADFLSTFVLADEVWAAGSAAQGRWLLRRKGETVEARSLLTPSAPRLSPPVRQPELPALPLVPIELRLRHEPRRAPRAEASLCDDAELPWLARYAMGRELSETAFLAFGPGWHLLLAPGGLTEAVPFGQPLWRIGPGALFLPLAHTFDPPLPASARAELYPPKETVAYAISKTGAFSFDLSNARPVWALWMGEPPKVQSGLSTRAQDLLKEVDAVVRAPKLKAESLPPAKALHEIADPSNLRRLALSLEASGRPEEAAACMERLGDFAAAARLYEQAAEARRYE